MDVDYCVLCQEAHHLTRSCLLNVQCKRCGQIGHLRIDCSGQDFSLKVEVKNDYKESSSYQPETQNNIVKQDDCGSNSGQEDIARQGIKRKSSNQVSSCPPKSVKYMLESVLKADDPGRVLVNSQTHISNEPEPTVEPAKIPGSEYFEYGEAINSLDSSEDGCDKDDKDSGSKIKDKFKMSCKSKVNLQLTKQNDCNNNLQSEVKSRHKEKKSSELKAGTYNIVSVHIELFRSNKSSSTKLTQIGCVVSGSNPSLFFKAIKPCGIEKYLENYKLGGDLLQALHMTREDDGTFLFTCRFETINEREKVVCIEESEALKSFLNFLENFQTCVLLGVDEDTVSILEQKLKDVDEEKFNNNIKGFTYWKRVLKYLDVDGYNTIDLEEYYSNMVGEDLPRYTTASDIASVLVKSVIEVTSKEKAGMRSLDSHFYKLCKRIECIEYPRKFDYDSKASVENVEVFSSFRLSVSVTFSVDKLEQVTLSSESDTETEETQRSNTRRVEDKSLMQELNDDLALLRRLTPTVHTLPTMSDTWQIGKPTKNEGTVVCPSPQCSAGAPGIRYSKISKHLTNSHPHVVDCLLCPFCKSLVSPEDIRVHMPKCSGSSRLPPHLCMSKEDMVIEELFKLKITSGINFAKYANIPLAVTGDNKPQPIAKFSDAGLRPLLMENVMKSGYRVPTPVQKNAIPIIMAGRDLMACAQTGSGKTAAFLLPIIHKLISSQADSGTGSPTACPQALVITHTRELAIQIYSEARKFTEGSMIKPAVAYGGTSIGYQAKKLAEGCNILVATPGRLLNYVDKGKVSFRNIQFLVLNEADQLLDMDFMLDIQKCAKDPNMPDKGKRQTLMFSHSFPDDIQSAAQEFLNDYLFLTVARVPTVEQTFHEVDKFDKRIKLEELLNDPARDPNERTLIFVQIKKNADFLSSHLVQEGLPTTSIHGGRLQKERVEALYDFRVGSKPILVATAVAARGLNIPGVAHVINYDMPDYVEEYVHRIGYTGHVGNIGKVSSLYDTVQDSDIAGPLVKMLADAGITAPDWLEEAGKISGEGGGGDYDDDEDWG